MKKTATVEGHYKIFEPEPCMLKKGKTVIFSFKRQLKHLNRHYSLARTFSANLSLLIKTCHAFGNDY